MSSDIVRVLQAIHPNAGADLLQLLNSTDRLPDSLVEVHCHLRNGLQGDLLWSEFFGILTPALLVSPFLSPSLSGYPTPASLSPPPPTPIPAHLSSFLSTASGRRTVGYIVSDDAQLHQSPSLTPSPDLGINMSWSCGLLAGVARLTPSVLRSGTSWSGIHTMAVSSLTLSVALSFLTTHWSCLAICNCQQVRQCCLLASLGIWLAFIIASTIV